MAEQEQWQVSHGGKKLQKEYKDFQLPSSRKDARSRPKGQVIVDKAPENVESIAPAKAAASKGVDVSNPYDALSEQDKPSSTPKPVVSVSNSKQNPYEVLERES